MTLGAMEGMLRTYTWCLGIFRVQPLGPPIACISLSSFSHHLLLVFDTATSHHPPQALPLVLQVLHSLLVLIQQRAIVHLLLKRALPL